MTPMRLRPIALCAALGAALVTGPGLPADAQGISFGGIRADASLPVEITADRLNVDEATGMAVFSGNVVVVQGAMRMAAARLEVEYEDGTDRRRIRRLHATGGVTLVNAADAAESREATYAPATGQVVMTGDVVLIQGPSVMSGQRLDVDLTTGTGRIGGRVRTVIAPSGAPE